MSGLFDLVLELVFVAIELALAALFAGKFSKKKPAQDLLERQRRVDGELLYEVDAEKDEQARRVLEEAKRRRASRVSGAPVAAVQASPAPSDCPECRAYNPPHSAFCGECGATLGIPAA